MPTTLESPKTAGPAPQRTAPSTVRAAYDGTRPASPAPAWLDRLRRDALERFERTGYPTLADEDWRFTQVAPLAALPFRPSLPAPGTAVEISGFATLPFAALGGDRLVFADGRFQPALSRIAAHDGGVVVASLASALRETPALVEPHLARLTREGGDAFAALNEAFFTDGAFIHVPAGREIAAPIQIILLATGREDTPARFCRNLIVAGAGARLTMVEQSAGLDGATGVNNVVTELVAADDAVVEHVRFQDDPASMFNIGALHLHLGRAVRLNAHSFALGARLSRYSIRAGLHGEGIEAVLNGLYLVDAERLADHHMIVDHAQPHCASHEYFNGILAGRSRGVFHGRILVRPGAQKTDAKQTNKNILLSDDATVDTKPQLEIYADDVKCTHGATVGQLHPEHVFYLRARGIPVETARRMLIHGFAGEIIDRVACAPLRDELDRLVWDRLEQDEQVHIGAHA